MATLSSDLSNYASDNPTATYDIICIDGTSYLGVGVAEVLDDGLLVFADMPNTAPRLYMPYTAVVTIKVTGTYVPNV